MCLWCVCVCVSVCLCLCGVCTGAAVGPASGVLCVVQWILQCKVTSCLNRRQCVCVGSSSVIRSHCRAPRRLHTTHSILSSVPVTLTAARTHRQCARPPLAPETHQSHHIITAAVTRQSQSVHLRSLSQTAMTIHAEQTETSVKAEGQVLSTLGS